MTIAVAALWIIALSWLGVLILTLHGLARQKFLLPISDLRLTASDAPLVSILVPARNEERRVLADCIRSIIAQDYGRFEVIAVDDGRRALDGNDQTVGRAFVDPSGTGIDQNADVYDVR